LERTLRMLRAFDLKGPAVSMPARAVSPKNAITSRVDGPGGLLEETALF